MKAQFHLALPCLSINNTKKFYVDVLGAKKGRFSENWIDINLYNNQITFTKSGAFNFESKSYNFGGHILPSFHFGVILSEEQWNGIISKLKTKNVSIKDKVEFLIDKTGEHHSFFLKDPNGYTVEFKCFKNENDVFNT